MAAVAALPGGARACPRVNTGRVPETGAVFGGAEFSGGTVRFNRGKFSGGTVNFKGATFAGGEVIFSGAAEFSGGEINFSGAMDWSHPPIFGWDGKPPTGVVLPVQPSEEQRRGH